MKTNVTLHPCHRFEMEVSGVEKRFQVSGEKAVTTKNYMDVEERGQNLEIGGRKSEVRGQKRGILLWERLSSRDSTTGLAH